MMVSFAQVFLRVITKKKRGSIILHFCEKNKWKIVLYHFLSFVQGQFLKEHRYKVLLCVYCVKNAIEKQNSNPSFDNNCSIFRQIFSTFSLTVYSSSKKLYTERYAYISLRPQKNCKKKYFCNRWAKSLTSPWYMIS